MLIDTIMKEHPDRKRPDAVFKIQNVADYSWADPKFFEAGYLENCFSYRLPFPVVWFEFQSPKIASFADRMSCGALAWIEEYESSGRAFNVLSFFDFRGQIGCLGGICLLINESYKAIPDSVFLLRRPDELVRVLGFRFREPTGKDVTDELPDEKFSVANLPIITTALNFLHCRNVDIVESHIPEKLIRANIKRGKERPYFEKYYTLAIEPMKQILNTEGQAQSVGIRKAFHICRGHFKTYGEKPLFGRVRGTFWTPAHVRGSVERGVIKKDYEIKI